MIVKICTALVCLGFLMVPYTAAGWSAQGHRYVGELALETLPEDTRNQLLSLFGDSSANFVEGCVWPDVIRSESPWKLSKPWHYINMPRNEMVFDAERDCREDNCVIGALNVQIARLRDAGADTSVRQEAVKFVCHFVGDLHQPLHVGYADDRGGNNFLVSVPKSIDTRGSDERMNLHALWDDLLLRYLGDQTAQRAAIRKACASTALHGTETAAIERWMLESRSLVVNTVYPRSQEISLEYFRLNSHLAAERVCLAGRRLAAVIDELFSP